MGAGYGNRLWELVMGTGYGSWLWELVMGAGYGNWLWELVMGTGYGTWLCLQIVHLLVELPSWIGDDSVFWVIGT